jgi:hypothetical protein
VPGADPTSASIAWSARAPFGVDVVTIVPPRKRQAHRLDDVRDQRRHTQRLGDAQCILDLLLRTGQEVDRDQHAPCCGSHVLPVARRRHVRLGHEDRDVGFSKDTLGCRTEEQLTKSRQSVTAHHDECRARISGDS